jgi:hypothetical protein
VQPDPTESAAGSTGLVQAAGRAAAANRAMQAGWLKDCLECHWVVYTRFISDDNIIVSKTSDDSISDNLTG